MSQTSIENMMGFINKEAIIYSTSGFSVEGTVKDVNEKNLIMETQKDGKTALLNKRNIFMIQEK